MNGRSEALGIPRPRARAADFLELTKPRITALVVVTTWVGWVVASHGASALGVLLHTLLGTALVCGGTNALNQVWERHSDALMQRTCKRP
ncbi:MAG: UbiA family prenyltransferase, partial [Candidatus Krumholzibacteriia bacterium]